MPSQSPEAAPASRPASNEEDNHLRETVRLPDESAVADLTEEDIAKIKATALKLLQTDTGVHNACVNLVFARRLYNVALQSLNRRMDELGKEQAIELFLTESMKHQSGQEFTREELLDQFTRSTLPWLTAEIKEEKDRERALAVQDAAKEEMWRREQIVPIPFEPDREWPTRSIHGLPGVGRKRTMTLAGHPGAVRCVLDLVMTFMLRLKEDTKFQRPSLVRFTDEMINHNVLYEKGSQIFHKIGVNRWLHSARTVRVMHETVQPFLKTLVRGRIDVCLVDDAAQLREPLGDMPPWYLAGNIQRNAHKWAEESGAALILGLPFEVDRDITQHWEGITLNEHWTQLEVYTDLVQLVVTEDSPETYQINAMRHGDTKSLMRIGSVPRHVLLAKRREPNSDEATPIP
jgi:hypothetical protein